MGKHSIADELTVMAILDELNKFMPVTLEFEHRYVSDPISIHGLSKRIEYIIYYKLHNDALSPWTLKMPIAFVCDDDILYTVDLSKAPSEVTDAMFNFFDESTKTDLKRALYSFDYSDFVQSFVLAIHDLSIKIGSIYYVTAKKLSEYEYILKNNIVACQQMMTKLYNDKLISQIEKL